MREKEEGEGRHAGRGRRAYPGMHCHQEKKCTLTGLVHCVQEKIIHRNDYIQRKENDKEQRERLRSTEIVKEAETGLIFKLSISVKEGENL